MKHGRSLMAKLAAWAAGAVLLAPVTAMAAVQANILTVVEVQLPSDALNAVEKTDDSGGLAGEEGKDDGFPDPGEAVEVPLAADMAKITLQNKPAPGVKQGVDVVVERVDVTYSDGCGQTQAYAPRHSVAPVGTVLVPTGGTAQITFELVPYSMKVSASANARALRDVFLFPASAQELQCARGPWTATIVVYSSGVEPNDDNPSVRHGITLSFVNPN